MLAPRCLLNPCLAPASEEVISASVSSHYPRSSSVRSEFLAQPGGCHGHILDLGTGCLLLKPSTALATVQAKSLNPGLVLHFLILVTSTTPATSLWVLQVLPGAQGFLDTQWALMLSVSLPVSFALPAGLKIRERQGGGLGSVEQRLSPVDLATCHLRASG